MPTVCAYDRTPVNGQLPADMHIPTRPTPTHTSTRHPAATRTRQPSAGPRANHSKHPTSKSKHAEQTVPESLVCCLLQAPPVLPLALPAPVHAPSHARPRAPTRPRMPACAHPRPPTPVRPGLPGGSVSVCLSDRLSCFVFVAWGAIITRAGAFVFGQSGGYPLSRPVATLGLPSDSLGTQVMVCDCIAFWAR